MIFFTDNLIQVKKKQVIALRGLYVSTGGYTSDAAREAERSREPVTLLDRDDFIRLLIEHYDMLEPEYKAQVPLRKVWMPAE